MTAFFLFIFGLNVGFVIAARFAGRKQAEILERTTGALAALAAVTETNTRRLAIVEDLLRKPIAIMVHVQRLEDAEEALEGVHQGERRTH